MQHLVKSSLIAVTTILASMSMGITPTRAQAVLPSETVKPVEAAASQPNPAVNDTLQLAMHGVYFIPNEGQWSDSAVQFGLRSRGMDVAFRESAFTMHLRREKPGAGVATTPVVEPTHRSISKTHVETEYETLTLGVSFPGCNAVLPEGTDEKSGKFNYFVGGEGRNSEANVSSFGSIIYHNLYDGIDLLVTGNEDGILKYEFHVAPGVDYSQIRIAYGGIDGLCVMPNGDVQIETAFGSLLDNAPVVWQQIDGARRALIARFEAVNDTTYTINLPEKLDAAYPIIIDPQVDWMIYLGGSNNEWGESIAVDSAGNALITGWTYSTDFEGHNNNLHGGDIDAFIVKVDSSGNLMWMTYLGGSDGEGGYGIAVDGAGNALVSGWTTSTDFEGQNNNHHGVFNFADAFVVKVDSSGNLKWMTYLGGSDDESGSGIAVDGSGNALITGYTSSTDFEGRNNNHHGGFHDAFIVKVDSSGIVQWMIYLGGSGDDWGRGIAVDGAGNALVSGWTKSNDFKGRNNNYHGGGFFDGDAFSVKVNSSGVLQWMTYLGGSNFDDGYGIAVDSAGNVFITGVIISTNFKGRTNNFHGYFDAFIVKVNSSGNVMWMTYLGGSGDDQGYGVAVDSAGDALVSGWTESKNFEGRINNRHEGLYDAFIVKVDSSGIVQWMTYLGGSGDDKGYGIAVDSAGNALVSGHTYSTDFEGRNNNFHGGDHDAFIVKVSDRISSCLLLEVDQFVAGQTSTMILSQGTPGSIGAIVYGRKPGTTSVQGLFGYCATFGMKGISTKSLIAELTFDSNGSFTVQKMISAAARGLDVSIQGAERDTCPDECVSNLVNRIVR